MDVAISILGWTFFICLSAVILALSAFLVLILIRLFRHWLHADEKEFEAI